MKKELISVIIPVYNVEPFLKRCLDSVIKQTYSNLEIILVDDGSEDNSGNICDDYQNKDSRIKVIHKKNGGLSSARNKGLDESKGNLILFLDSDDWIDLNYIDTLYNDLKKNDCDISVPGFCLSYDNGKHINDSKIQKQTIFTTEDALSNFLFNGYITPCVASKLWKRNLWKNIRCPEGKLFEDQFTTYKLIMKSKKISFNPSVNYYYYKRNGSIGHSSFSSRTYDLLNGINEEYEVIVKNYPNLKNNLIVAKITWEVVFINFMIPVKEEYNFNIINDVRKEINKNKKNILNCKYIGKIRKFQILLLGFNFNLYKLMYRIYKLKFKTT